MKKITVRLYNNRYAFEEVLQFNFEDQYEVQIYEDWLKCKNIDCLIIELPKNHPLYGWLECYGQGSNMLDIDFTHIKLTIEETKTEFLERGYFYSPYRIEQETVEITMTEEQKARYNKPVSNIYYGKITFGGNKEGDASGEATCLENKVDGE